MSAGVVVRAADVARHEAGPGASLRFLVETGNGAPGLVRRLADLAPGGRIEGRSVDADELWFVLGGAGELEAGGQPAIPLHPDRGVLIPSGMAFAVRTAAAAGLRLDMVALPAAPGAAGLASAGTGPVVSDFADAEIETTGDRQFRVLFGPGKRCPVATQFVGEIPPGRAPEHSHPYDEVVLILQGEGIAHIGGAEHPLSAGTCANLPPGLVHCLENTGSDTLRVLGVFHPADSPAAKLQQRG
jgi:quercetin dioxygenase-like cupin family protein